MSISSIPEFGGSQRGDAATATRQARVAEWNAVVAPQPKPIRPIRVVLVLYRDDLNVGGSLRVVEILANALTAGVRSQRGGQLGRFNATARLVDNPNAFGL